MQETNREIDLGALTLYDNNPVPVGQNDEETMQNVTNAMIDNVKFIFTKAIETKKNQIALRESLPEQEQIHDFNRPKYYIDLPECGILFPRGYKLTEEKPPTKWQRYAKQKNIKKRKKTGMVYDNELKTQVARWGKKSKKNMFQPAIMQEKQHGRNPFDDQKKSKKLNKQQQKLKQLKNVQRRQNFKNRKR